jgi:hypothetical protein
VDAGLLDGAPALVVADVQHRVSALGAEGAGIQPGAQEDLGESVGHQPEVVTEVARKRVVVGGGGAKVAMAAGSEGAGRELHLGGGAVTLRLGKAGAK